MIRAALMMCVALALIDAPFSLAGDFSGAGATFPYPIYAKWAESYKKETGNNLNYQSVGSSGGIAQITRPRARRKKTIGGGRPVPPSTNG